MLSDLVIVLIVSSPRASQSSDELLTLTRARVRANYVRLNA
jgi:hypothetical protein